MYELKEKAKAAAVVTVPVVMTGVMSITSFASEEGTSVTDSVSTALVSAVTDIASSIGTVIGQVIPIALPLIGASLVVTIGIKIFKAVANKA